MEKQNRILIEKSDHILYNRGTEINTHRKDVCIMEQLKIGWARREISTNDPVSIRGQMHIRISEGILDPLYVTALALDGGEG